MNNYQRKINELEKELELIQNENKSLEAEQKELNKKIETENKTLISLLNTYSILIKKMHIANKDEEKLLLENLKLIIKAQGHVAGFGTIIHILATPLLITSFTDVPEQISDILSNYPAYYLDNMKTVFSIFIPPTLAAVIALNKNEIITKLKLHQGKINLEDLELLAYDYHEQIKVKEKEIAAYEKLLQTLEATVKENNQKKPAIQKEQTELIKEKNELYNDAINRYLEQAIENDLNEAYNKRYSKQQLFKHPNETNSSN